MLILANINRNLSSVKSFTPNPKQLYKYLMRRCEKLPGGPKEHYKFQIKQSFRQHKTESDTERIQGIIKRSLEDADWVMKKYFPEKI